MIVALALTSALIASTVSAREQTPAAMWVIFPKDFTPRAPSTAYVEAAATVLARETRIALTSAEAAGIDVTALKACDPGERYQCWLSLVRPETRYLFVVAVQPIGPDAEALALIFIDAQDTRAKLAALPAVVAGELEHRELVETEVFNRTVRAPAVQVDSTKRGALEAWFSERLRGPIRAQFAQNNDLDRLGNIRVYAPAKNWSLSLDGEILAATSSASTLITEILPGVRRVAITPPGATPIARDVRVEPARTATIAFGLDPVDSSAATDDGSLKYGMIFGGIAASSIGGVLLASAISRASNVRQTCVLRAGDEGLGRCEDLGTITLEHDAARLPALDPRRVNPAGVSIAPLAIGLIGGGAIIAGGAFLLRDFEEDWWWPIVTGVGFCAVSYGLGILVDGR